VTSLFLLMMGVNELRTSQKIDEVLTAAEADATTGAVSRKIGEEDFDTILASGSVEQLAKLLEQVNNWDHRTSAGGQISENQKRVEVATRLLQMPLDKELREDAIKAKFDALSIMYGVDIVKSMNLPNIAPNLQAFSETHRDDPNPEIAQLAKLSAVKVNTFEFLKKCGRGEQAHVQPVADGILQLMRDYPDDSLVRSNLQLIVTAVTNTAPQVGRDLIRALVSHVDEFKNPEIVNYFDSLNDELLLIDSGFKKLFGNRFVNGNSGRKELQACLISLAGNPVGGKKLLNTVVVGANWFEEANYFEGADEVYRAMAGSAASRISPESAALAERLGNAGLARCGLPGKKWQFNGKLIGDLTWQKNLEVEKLAGRVVVVIFWSVDDRNSLAVIRKFHSKAKELAFKNVAVLAVCVDKKIDDKHSVSLQGLPSYIAVGYPSGVESLPASEISMLEQCPVENVPFALVIGSQGFVQAVNVPMDELKTATEYAVLKQREGR
jgi:hypothetical protein